MKIQISYADEVYREAQKWNEKFALWFGGFDKVISYSEKDLDEEFKQKNHRILSQKRGGGYWIWKSYIIKKTLNIIEDGDYLFYCDAGGIFVKNVNKLIHIMEHDHQEIMLFEVYDHLECHWTKRDIFKYIDFDNEECAYSNQIMGGFILIKKSNETVSFFNTYLEICQQKELITDSPNEMGFENYEGFDENRHDGSILSVLAKKNKIKPYKDPSQWGIYQRIKYKRKEMLLESNCEVYERSPYSMIIYLHRYKKINLKNIVCSLRDTLKLYIKVAIKRDIKF